VEELPCLVACPGAAEGAPNPELASTELSRAASACVQDQADEEEAAAAAARKLLARLALRGWQSGTFGSGTISGPPGLPGEEEAEEKGEGFHQGEGNGRARQKERNSMAAPNGRARCGSGCVASGSLDSSAGRVPLSPKGGGRVWFDLSSSTVHEIIPYSEIYGKHPREFVFDRHSCMVPAVGPYGFVGFAGTSDEDEEEEAEEAEAEAEAEIMGQENRRRFVAESMGNEEDGLCGVGSCL